MVDFNDEVIIFVIEGCGEYFVSFNFINCKNIIDVVVVVIVFCCGDFECLILDGCY